MSYRSEETSQYSAQPVELYKFVHGLEAFCYTSADADFVYLGDTYLADAVSRSQIDQSNEDHAGSLDVSVPRESAIAALFVAYLPTTPVSVTVYRLHRGAADDVVTAFRGRVNSATFNENECKLFCAARSEVLARSIPIAVYQPQCNHVLYSQSRAYDLDGGTRAQTVGCGVSRDAFRVSIVASAAHDTTLVASGLGTKPDGWFTYGYVERVSDGDVRWITAHAGGSVELSYPFTNLTPGEALNAYPGCNGTEDTCLSKFNNVVNFGGFTRMPSKNPYTSSIQ